MATTICRTGLNDTAVIVVVNHAETGFPAYTTGRIETDCDGLEYSYSFAGLAARPFVCRVDNYDE